MGISIYDVDVTAISPMMQHYVKTKEEYSDCILFYRLGDFYEMFFEDAQTVSKELELTLTGKDCGMAERAPMCGVPFHAAEVYINRLISKGYKVAVCEQVEDPKQAKGIVKREVIRVVTPGTTLNTQALDETKNNYIMSVVYLSNRFGIAIADGTTGDFMVTEVENIRKLLRRNLSVASYLGHDHMLKPNPSCNSPDHVCIILIIYSRKQQRQRIILLKMFCCLHKLF